MTGQNVWDFLTSAQGIELTHAVVLLITSLAAYFGYLAHRQSKNNERMLNGHLEEHMMRSQSPPPPPLSDLPPEA